VLGNVVHLHRVGNQEVPGGLPAAKRERHDTGRR
jgi:hypothetical protein